MSKLIISTLIAAGLAAAVPAGAQTAAPVAGSQASHAPGMHRGHDTKRAFSKPTERIEAKLAYLKTALKITDKQQPQWDAFANLQRKQAAEREKRMDEWHARMAQGSGQREHHRPTAIERLERMQQFHAEGIRRLNEQLEVQKPFYAVLTNEQKQVADELLAPHGSRHGHGMKHGDRRMGA